MNREPLGLAYLDFDASEDAEGCGSFDAMASVAPPQWNALQQEVLGVLAWAEDAFPGARGPLEEGGAWDFELQAVEEVATALQVEPDAGGRTLQVRRGATGAPRTTLSLTLSGSAQFCAAFRDAFGLE
ncbi:MAG: hypothetical protein JWP65_2416 [Ramlibacter sp.]|jgi:hypothetical protein|uniref:hypothetical protein n=1 Tax=Ramlibacter sp. TaxID=1917967 RepID=UPI00262EA36E|nr:hypothetical protein [Ramlibacter sp.]MDB5751995.1 hypothetical protein [Ramlibacter sp.]